MLYLTQMLPEYFAIIGAVVASLGNLYYLYETIIGKAKPNRVTWLLWGLFPIIIFIAQRAQGVEGVVWVSFAAGVTPLLVVLASFLNKKAYWKTQPLDYVLMASALLAMIIWAITNDANIAILIALVADLLAGVPTIIKSFHHPETESWRAYAIGAVGLGISVLALQSWSFESSAFVIYLFTMQTLFTILTVRRPAKLHKA